MEELYLNDDATKILNKYIETLKVALAKKYVYYMMKKNDDSNIKYLKYSVLLSWFSDVYTYEEFLKKFESFGNMMSNNDIKDIFERVKNITTTEEANKHTMIMNTKRKYNETIKTKIYKEKSIESGFSLPNTYLDEKKYHDLTIHKNIQFINLIYQCLTKIDKELKEIRAEIYCGHTKDKVKKKERKYE